MPTNKPRFTQWAAQFAVASELCKRGYEVALTLGNHPAVDLMVRSPGGFRFGIDVKGLYKKNYFLLKPKEAQDDLFYVLAYVPNGEPNQFFLLRQSEANREVHEDFNRIQGRQIAKGGSGEKAGLMPGISWSAVQPYRDRWDELPR